MRGRGPEKRRSGISHPRIVGGGVTNDAWVRAANTQGNFAAPPHRWSWVTNDEGVRSAPYQRCVGADGVKPGCRVGGSVRAYRLKVAVRQHRDMSLE